MPLDQLRRQFHLLCTGSFDALALAMDQALLSAASLAPTRHVPAGIVAAVGRDLTYALIRHRHFLSAPLLTDALVDFVATHYELERAVAANLAGTLVRVLGAEWQAPASHVVPSNREFLRYVFVACATASSEAELLLDLGLGDRLITRIRGALALVTLPGETVDGVQAAQFLPELDAEITTIMCDLADEQRTLPWALQVHRLDFQLLASAEPWRGVLAAHGVRWLFDLLLAVGSSGKLTTSQFTAQLAALPFYADLPELADPLAATALLDALHQAELIAPFSASATDRHWQLTPLAQELTAEAYADALLRGSRSPWSLLAKLNPAYQTAVIRVLPEASAEQLLELAVKSRPLSPAGLTATLQRLQHTFGMEAYRDTCVAVVRQDPSPWLRNAALKGLEGLEGIGQLLAEVARFDASPAVRTTAARLLVSPADRLGSPLWPEPGPVDPANDRHYEERVGRVSTIIDGHRF